MSDDERSEFNAELRRVGVDRDIAWRQLNEFYEPKIHNMVALDDDTVRYTKSIMYDISGMIDTLRGLLDNAGTEAFVAAYNRAHPDWREGKEDEQ